MNLKEYYKQVLVNSSIQEEIIKVKPREAALIRQQLSLRPKSTDEKLGGSEVTALRGSDWNTASQKQVNKAATVLAKDERELKRSAFVGRYRHLPPQEKSLTGLRNFLLHNTKQNPDEIGLSIDATSPPRVAKQKLQPPSMTAVEIENRRDAISRLYDDDNSSWVNLHRTVQHFHDNHGIDLKLRDIEGIDFTNPDVESHIRTISSRLGL